MPDTLEQEVLELHQEHAAGLLRYAAAFLHESTGALDAVQEVFLRYFLERSEGLSYAEIAEVLGLSGGSVGCLLARAHKKIRRAGRGG